MLEQEDEWGNKNHRSVLKTTIGMGMNVPSNDHRDKALSGDTEV